jgi:hypothetical protein
VTGNRRDQSGKACDGRPVEPGERLLQVELQPARPAGRCLAERRGHLVEEQGRRGERLAVVGAPAEPLHGRAIPVPDQTFAGGLAGQLVVVQADEMTIPGRHDVDLEAGAPLDPELEVGPRVRRIGAGAPQLVPFQPDRAAATSERDAEAHAASARWAFGISRSLA